MPLRRRSTAAVVATAGLSALGVGWGTGPAGADPVSVRERTDSFTFRTATGRSVTRSIHSQQAIHTYGSGGETDRNYFDAVTRVLGSDPACTSSRASLRAVYTSRSGEQAQAGVEGGGGYAFASNVGPMADSNPSLTTNHHVSFDACQCSAGAIQLHQGPK